MGNKRAHIGASCQKRSDRRDYMHSMPVGKNTFYIDNMDRKI